METWTPSPPNLAPPFIYSTHTISETSQTEAFDKGIDTRDGRGCVVCGTSVAPQHAHIVPKVDDERWEYLRTNLYIPSRSKSVAHEPRNGILLCANHHIVFDGLRFYIRWEPAFKRFIFINHSRHVGLERYHGRAVRLFPGDPRTPFYGAFIDHEMRVRGQYPYPGFADRPIDSCCMWQEWITDEDGGGDGGGGNVGKMGSGQGGGDLGASVESVDGVEGTSGEKITMITFKNPMTNPDELERIMWDAPQQASWKAAVIEGESWNGTATENMEKYQKLFSTSHDMRNNQ